MRFLCLLTCCLCLAALDAAQFAPRVSAREIPLNETLRITFTTGRPQLPEVDIAATVSNALALRAVQDAWRVVGEPVIDQHERAKDVTVIIRLAPRVAGQPDLPQIPVSWMLGDHVVNLGQVSVKPEIRVGGDSRPPPVELESIAGFRWGLSLAELRAQVAPEAPFQAGPPMVIEPREGLQLRLIGERLAGASLRVTGLSPAAARVSLVDRWGPPSAEDEERVEWQVGWLQVVARAEGESLLLDFSHNGILAEGLRAEIQRQVFGALEEDLRQPEEAPAANSEAAPDRFEAEFERRLTIPE